MGPVGEVNQPSRVSSAFLPHEAVPRRQESIAQLAAAGCPSTPRPTLKLADGKAICSTPSTTCSSPCATSPLMCTHKKKGELRVCRFCLDCEEVSFEEADNTPARKSRDAFVTPCPCRGSARYVHLDCLVQHFEAQGQWHNFKCPTCKQTYEGRALRELAQLSCERMRAKHGEESPQVAHSLCYLAQAHTQLGSVHKSKEFLEQGLAIAQKHFGEGHVATAATLAELATVHGKMGDVQMQRKLLESSLEIKEKHFGIGHINTAVTLNNLAAAFSELGDIEQEKKLLERSLEIKEQQYGKGHVQTTAALVNLAGVNSELGDMQKSLELLEWSLSIEERHFGEGHIETAITLNNLALACGESGDIARMQDVLCKCLAIKENHFGENHPELCLTLANMSMALAAMNEEEAARWCCERALAICERQPSSRRSGIVMLRAAAMHAALNELPVCSRLRKVALAMLDEVLGSAACTRVVESEGKRMARIWGAVGRADVATGVREVDVLVDCFTTVESGLKCSI